MSYEQQDPRKASDRAFGLSGNNPRPSDKAFGVVGGEPQQPPMPEPAPANPDIPPPPPPAERAPIPPEPAVDPMQSGQAGGLNTDQRGLGGPQILPPDLGVPTQQAAPDPSQEPPQEP